MPAEVKILVEGFTNADSVVDASEEKTQPTITLVRDENIIMIVDPGIIESQQILTDALQKENLTVNDVNIVCITHSHLDHYRNIGMFPKAKTLEYYGLWHKNNIEDWRENFTSNIKVLHTPGHDYTGITLLVTTDKGVVAICGDVFWKKDYPREAKDDIYASDYNKLKESRAMVVDMADWIIPGHGPMYKNNETEPEVVPKKESGLKSYFAKIREVKTIVVCKRCGEQMQQKDRCLCVPYLCIRCCECGFDCPTCGCSHRR